MSAVPQGAKVTWNEVLLPPTAVKLVAREAPASPLKRTALPLGLDVVLQNVRLVSLEVNGVPRAAAVLPEEWMTLRGQPNIVPLE